MIGPYPPGSGKPRRWIVVNDEAEGETLLVCAFTSTSLSDPTTILRGGVHPAITRDCCVIYVESSLADADQLREGWRRGAMQAAGRLRRDLVQAVQEGILESPDTPDDIVAFLTDRI